jgi:ABC-type branched-subunit amino acid transport system substrate-binding protein
MGFKLEKVVKLKPASPESDSAMSQVAEGQPDLVLIWLDPEPAGVAANALRSGGFKGGLAGPGRLRSAEFAKSAGKALEGFVTTEIVLDSSSQEKLRVFQTAFRDRYGHEPDPMSVFSYDAARLLTYILETGGARAETTFPIHFPWAGASGAMSFDAEGNRCADFRLRVAHLDSVQQSAAGNKANKEK